MGETVAGQTVYAPTAPVLSTNGTVIFKAATYLYGPGYNVFTPDHPVIGALDYVEGTQISGAYFYAINEHGVVAAKVASALTA
jgi:hypothetical protein